MEGVDVWVVLGQLFDVGSWFSLLNIWACVKDELEIREVVPITDIKGVPGLGTSHPLCSAKKPKQSLTRCQNRM